MRPTAAQSLVLFSPAFVLIIWAVITAAQDGYVSTGSAAFFLIVLALAVAAAERVRITMRHKLMDRIRKRDRGK
jgi:hypothetical protein